ncbi:MAG: hypothetical protein RBT55_01980 [Rhodocyclaceae bacterium]|jgi:putative transposase|nr:hypothetical protein [Rhodocyclaceae bacterium]
MVNYRRNRIAGGCYFFTVTLRDRQSDGLTRHIDLLRASWQQAQQRIPHRIIAVAILPEHLHAVLELAPATSDYSSLWREIKKVPVSSLTCQSRKA